MTYSFLGETMYSNTKAQLFALKQAEIKTQKIVVSDEERKVGDLSAALLASGMAIVYLLTMLVF